MAAKSIEAYWLRECPSGHPWNAKNICKHHKQPRVHLSDTKTAGRHFYNTSSVHMSLQHGRWSCGLVQLVVVPFLAECRFDEAAHLLQALARLPQGLHSRNLTWSMAQQLYNELPAGMASVHATLFTVDAPYLWSEP